MLLLFLVGTIALVQAPSAALERRSPAHSLDQILDALRTIESGGTADEGRSATGDGGLAIGPYQIHRAHWQDSRLPGRFEDCRDASYARREVIAYWQRWCPDALERLDAEVLARVHNGGPDGARQACTLAFWRKMQKALDQKAREAADVARIPRAVGARSPSDGTGALARSRGKEPAPRGAPRSAPRTSRRH